MCETDSGSESRQGFLGVFIGPAGVGKGEIIERLLGFHDIERHRTITTRRPRPGEIPGHHRDFTDDSGFARLRDSGALLEFEEVHRQGVFYGTPREPMLSGLANGKRFVLEIDVNGWMSIQRLNIPIIKETSLSIFVTATRDEIANRIKRRQPDIPQSDFDRRMASFERELQMSYLCTHVVANPEGRLEDTVQTIKGLIDYRLKPLPTAS